MSKFGEITFGQKFHNVSVTDGPPAKQIEKNLATLKRKFVKLIELNNFSFQSCSIFSIRLAGGPSVTDTFFHILKFLPIIMINMISAGGGRRSRIRRSLFPKVFLI